MARLALTTTSVIREYLEAAAYAIALVVCMPILGIVAFLLRGVAVGVLASVLVLVGAIGAWHWAEPRLSPAWRAGVREVALGALLLAGIPVLVAGVLVLQGAVVALLPVAGVVLGVAGLWRIIAGGRRVIHAPLDRASRTETPHEPLQTP